MIAKTFPGGYTFKGFEGQPKDKLVSLGTPPKVIIPLSQGFGTSLEPIVSCGDTVFCGQIIARDDNSISSCIHSSVNGRVVSVEKRNYFNREVKMVAIEADGNQDYRKLEGCLTHWDKLSVEKIEELLYTSGVTSLDREGIPTHFKTSVIAPEDVEDLIIHGGGSELYNISLNTLLEGKNLFNFVEGIKILRKIIPNARIHVAFNSEKKAIIERFKKLTIHLDYIKLHSIIPKYPQGYDEILVPTILGKKFPYGYSAANIGIVVLNIQATLKVYEAVAEGKPLIERIVALLGPAFKKNLHVKVKVGTPLEHILKDRLKEGPSRIVLNSLLTGFELNDPSLPVNRTFSQIIAIPEETQRIPFAFLRPGVKTDSYSNAFLSKLIKKRKVANTNLRGDQRPCIQCGYCIEVCPVRIMPIVIDRFAKLGINETLMRHGIFNCIECGLCSYVCPSKIPLAENLKTAKTKLIETGCDHSLCILPKFNLRGLEGYKGVKTVR